MVTLALGQGHEEMTLFFVSTVLSAVLTHHLGWTNQFLREISSSGSNPLLTPSTGSSIQTQADDICGLVGFPPVSAKTVVLGTDLTIIHRFLALIPYFIRCDPVKETSFGPPNLNLQACRSSVSQDTLTPDFSPRLKRTRSHAAKLVEKLYPDLGMHKKTLSADFSARRGEHPGKPVQFVLGHDDEQLVLHSSPDLRECADVECEPVEMVLLESEEASLAAAANKVFKESLSVETLKPEISPKLKRTCSFTSKLADEFAQSNACQHRKTRSADFRLSVPVQAEVIAEDDDDDERKPPVVEFVLGQNERLVLNKVKEQGVCEKQLIQVKEMVIPEIKIETVTPVGRSCAIRKTLDGCKSWSRRHWHQRVDRLSREAARVTVVRTTRFDMNNSPSHCQRRSSDPVDAKVPEEFLGRFSRFLSLQVGDSGRKRGSISEGQRACLYPNLSLEEDFDGLGCLPEQVDNLDLEGIDCPRVDVLGVNTDPSWTPSRTMFAGVGPRIVCGVALSGVLVPPPSSSASGMHHGGPPPRLHACDVQPEAVCILADTGNWVVETINQPRSVSWPLSQAQGQMAVAAPCVASMLETVVSLAKAF
ncbi:unnamed protein product [Notodromas monacha]|uniref:Uncharacterized protein n=1 Tax=Notodromas monacha TaxID=399045 RepID=A0A7R9BWF1_9CRUS|nr:unnamed protein product [Notodromas monacha]CAG0923037.1 unnamed protein product [Notodromas monacha]